MRRTPSRRLLAAALLVASAPAPMATTPATAAPAPPPPGLRLRHANTFRPGADFQYSNSNLVRLGLVIEKVTGRKLADVIHERVLRPAGLRHTLLPAGRRVPRAAPARLHRPDAQRRGGGRHRLEPQLGLGGRGDDLRPARPVPLGEGRRHRRTARPRDPGAAAADAAHRLPRDRLRPRRLRDQRLDRAQRLDPGLRDRDRLPALPAGDAGHHDQHGRRGRGPGTVDAARPGDHRGRDPGQRLRRLGVTRP